MSSKCCNVDLVPIILSVTVDKPECSVGFSAFGTTQTALFCSKCGKLNRTESTDKDAPEFYKEAIR